MKETNLKIKGTVDLIYRMVCSINNGTIYSFSELQFERYNSFSKVFF